jgi:mRNA interferase MazF
MKRGEIWTVAGGTGYAGKPRPAVIVQGDLFDILQSVTVCPFTRQVSESDWVRIVVEPSEANGLDAVSRLMVDKITTTSKDRIGNRIGALDREDIVRMDRALSLFLALGSTVVSG